MLAILNEIFNNEKSREKFIEKKDTTKYLIDVLIASIRKLTPRQSEFLPNDSLAPESILMLKNTLYLYYLTNDHSLL